MSTMTKTHFTKFIKQIKAADDQQVVAQLKIAHVLTAIRDNELHKLAGYNNFQMMVRGELDFAPSCAVKYISLYNSYTKFKYSEDEFLKLMRQFSWRRLEEALRNSPRKMGARAINNFIRERSDAESNQFNFNLHDKKLAQKLELTLGRFGLEVTQGGTRSHLTTSFLAMLEDYEQLSNERDAREAKEPKDKPGTTGQLKFVS